MDRFISYIGDEGMSGLFLLLPCFVEISKFNANSVDPDHTPCSAASDLGLHFLPMSLLWDARLKWVNESSGTHKITIIIQPCFFMQK